MAITVVGTVTSNRASAGGNCTVTLPTELQQDDWVYVFAGWGANPGGGTSSSGWTQVGSDQSNGTGCKTQVWKKKMGASPDTSIVLTGSGAAESASAGLAIGLRGVSGDDATPTVATGNSTNPDCPSNTSTTANALAIAFAAGNAKDNNATAPTGYSNSARDGVNDNSSTQYVQISTKALGAAGAENPASYTQWNTGLWVAWTLLIRETLSVAADAGSYDHSGQDASPLSGRILAADVTSYSHSGVSAEALSGRATTGDAGSYAHSGDAITLAQGNRFDASAGQYDHTGADVTLSRGILSSASAGSYDHAGDAASLAKLAAGAFGISAGVTTYDHTGTDAALKSARKIAAASDTYLMSGQTAGVLVVRTIAAVAGAYDWSGTVVTFRKGVSMPTEAGPYSHVGSGASIVFGAYLPADHSRYAWMDDEETVLTAMVYRVLEPYLPGPHKPSASRFNDRAFDEGTRNGGNLRK